MSWTYRGFEGNDEHETPWYARETELFEDIIDMLPQNGTTYVSTEHYHSKLVSPDGTLDPAVQVVDATSVVVNPGSDDVDFTVNWNTGVGLFMQGSSGHVGVQYGASSTSPIYNDFTVESVGGTGMSIMSPTGNTSSLAIGAHATNHVIITGNATGGYLYYGGNERLHITATDVVVNDGGADVDFTVNWNTGVGLFVQGSSGLVGVGTATVQAWKTATYESVLSFGADGKCALVADGLTTDWVSDAFWDVVSDRYEHITAATAASRIALNQGIYLYQSLDRLGPTSAITWMDMFHAVWTGAGAGVVSINAGNNNVDTDINGDTMLVARVDAGQDALMLGSATDDTNKYGRLRIQQWDSAGEPEGFTGIYGYGWNPVTPINMLYIGGGDANANAANWIYFYTAANTTTRTGTLIGQFDTVGLSVFGTHTVRAGVGADMVQYWEADNATNADSMWRWMVADATGTITLANKTGGAYVGHDWITIAADGETSLAHVNIVSGLHVDSIGQYTGAHGIAMDHAVTCASTLQATQGGFGRTPTAGYHVDAYSGTATVPGKIAVTGPATAYGEFRAWADGGDLSVVMFGTNTGYGNIIDSPAIGYNDLTMIQANNASSMLIYTIGAAPMYLGANSAVAITISTAQAVTCAATLQATGLGVGRTPVSGGIAMEEIADPAEPSANGFTLYARDNGAGKTQICVRFNNGGGAADIAVLATES